METVLGIDAHPGLMSSDLLFSTGPGKQIRVHEDGVACLLNAHGGEEGEEAIGRGCEIVW